MSSIKKLSLDRIDCDICVKRGLWDGLDNPPLDFFVSKDTVAAFMFSEIRNSKAWETIKTGTPNFISFSSSGYEPFPVKLKKGEAIVIYEVSFDTPNADEDAVGQEGDFYSFRFIRQKKQFICLGIVATP